MIARPTSTPSARCLLAHARREGGGTGWASLRFAAEAAVAACCRFCCRGESAAAACCPFGDGTDVGHSAVLNEALCGGAVFCAALKEDTVSRRIPPGPAHFLPQCSLRLPFLRRLQQPSLSGAKRGEGHGGCSKCWTSGAVSLARTKMHTKTHKDTSMRAHAHQAHRLHAQSSQENANAGVGPERGGLSNGRERIYIYSTEYIYI